MNSINLARQVRVPGPAQLWSKYNRALASNPIATKAFTSVVAGVIGDFVAQWAARKSGPQSAGRYDYRRTLRMGCFGLVGGPVGHYWYQFLDRNMFRRAPTSPAAIVAKVALDQFVFAPLSTFVFYAYLTAAAGEPEKYIDTIRDKYWLSLSAGWKLWIPAHVVNFAFVPPSQRILYANVMSVVGTFILSRIANERQVPGLDTVVDLQPTHRHAHQR